MDPGHTEDADRTLEEALPPVALLGVAAVLFALEQVVLALSWWPRHGWLALLVAPAAAVLLPLVWLCHRAGLRFRAALRLRRPRPRDIAGATLVAVGALAPAHLASRALSRWVQPPEDLMDFYAALLPTGWLSLAGGVLAIVAVAPLAEEVLFRGLFLRGLARSTPAAIAVAVSALVFSAAHGAVWLMIPLFVLGLVLGGVAWRTGSVTSAWIAHAVFNGVAYAELCVTGDVAADAVARWSTRPLVAVALCIALGCGWSLLGRRRTEAAPLASDRESAAAEPGGGPKTDHL